AELCRNRTRLPLKGADRDIDAVGHREQGFGWTVVLERVRQRLTAGDKGRNRRSRQPARRPPGNHSSATQVTSIPKRQNAPNRIRYGMRLNRTALSRRDRG